MQGRSRVGISGWLLSLCLFNFLLVGCSHSSTLVVRCENRNKAFTQNFPQAVANCTEDGTYEFVLISDDARPQQSIQKASLIHRDKSGRPLNPSASMPLHQVVHVKVLWRPLDGTDRAVGSNASLVWYVLTDTAEGEGDLLEYRGSAYVMVDPKDDVTKVTIEDGTIKPGAVRGALVDPIGPARIEGRFTAINDGERLRAILDSTQQRARTAAAAMAQ
jgi:hypothetical protein